MTDAVPPEFEHYEVARVLGEGGMGIVYLAHDRRTDLQVAIKVRKHLRAPELQRRFVRENKILSSLSHRNIVRCYEVTRSLEGTPSLVMEYLDGVDLQTFEMRPYPELLSLMIQTLMGMDYLRREGILHRDLSANNVLVVMENGKRLVKILDFGIAKELQDPDPGAEGASLTLSGEFLGKFHYASPEAFFGRELDWRSDVYSLGVIFCRLLTGHYPIELARPSAFIDWFESHRKGSEIVIHSPEGVPDPPDALAATVRRMLARDPEDRPSSYEEIIASLGALQRELGGGFTPPGPGVATLTDSKLALPSTPLAEGRGPAPIEPPAQTIRETVQSAALRDDHGRESIPRPPTIPKTTLVKVLAIVAFLVLALVVLVARGHRPMASLPATPTPNVSVRSTSLPAILRLLKPEPGVRSIRLHRGQSLEFRVAVEGDWVPVWRLNDDIVARGFSYTYEARRAQVKELITVSIETAPASPPSTILWYVTVN